MLTFQEISGTEVDVDAGVETGNELIESSLLYAEA